MGQPTLGNLWLASAMYTCCLVQKKMQGISGRKGLTVFIMDDNKREMPKLSNALYERSAWYDELYEQQTRRRGKLVWVSRSFDDRFDQIVNTSFAVKSDHSSLVQVADAISYIYRRHLELMSGTERWHGEREFFGGLVQIIEPSRETLGRCRKGRCHEFYAAAAHPDWRL